MEKLVYLILGASSDVGLAFLDKLNKKEVETVVYAHYATNNEKLVEKSKAWTHLTLHYIKADLSLEADVKSLIESLKMDEVFPTHIVHLAALPFQYMKLKNWDEQMVKKEMDISLYSFAGICKEFLPLMAKNKFGRVLVMLSSYTIGVPPKFMSDYITVKYALLGFVKAMAAEYGEKGICINAISPNMMETKFLKGIDDRVVKMTAANSTLKRNVSLEEVSESMCYLLSAENSYMNGVNLNLSGGDRM